MAVAEDTGEGLTELQQRVQLRRAVVASSVGSIIEAYDFLLYGQVTGLVFGKLYFPASDPLVGSPPGLHERNLWPALLRLRLEFQCDLSRQKHRAERVSGSRGAQPVFHH